MTKLLIGLLVGFIIGYCTRMRWSCISCTNTRDFSFYKRTRIHKDEHEDLFLNPLD